MIDEQGRKFKMTPVEDPEIIHFTSEKAEALTYFTDKDNLSTNSVNQAIIDNGCPTNVAGKPWINLHAQSRGLEKFKTEKCSKIFKFGPSLTQEAKEKVIIPTKIGSKERNLEVYVINSTLPLLLSSSELIKWGAVQDYTNSTLTVDNEVIKLNNSGAFEYKLKKMKRRL